MSRIAPRVHTDATVIAALEALAARLPDGECVALTLDDGNVVRGVVSAVPTMQVFFDPAGTEGSNAVVRIEDPQDDSRDHYVWLDRISQITRQDLPSTR
ncbi:MAG: DUF3247 family protein [Luteimonas sp.]